MGELGYLEDPAYELGMLAAQAMRAVRVIVDIGMHLELPIIAGEPHAGETWTAELALPFVIERSRLPEFFMRRRSIAISAGRVRRSATRSASACGSSAGPMRKRARAPTST